MTAELTDATSGRLNWLRAGVLGASDGIVSVAAVVIGVASAMLERDTHLVLLAGLAALLGGAFSMALGEYVSVSSQRDSQRAARGGRHEPANEASPWHAAFASAIAFLAGGVIPLLFAVGLPPTICIPFTALSVLLALTGAGVLAARLGGSQARRSTLRVVAGGMLALVGSFALGALLGTTGVV